MGEPIPYERLSIEPVASRARRVLDHLVFGAVPSLSLFLALNGKPISLCLFADVDCMVRLDLRYMALHVVVLVPMGALITARILPALRTATSRGLLGAGAMAVACIGALYFRAPASPLIFFLVVGIFASTTFIVMIDAYLTETMQVEFWKLAFEALLKIFQWGILGVALIVTALAAFAAGHLDMITTLAYPVAIVIIQFAMLAYWNLLPVWNRLAAGYRVPDAPQTGGMAEDVERG